MIETLLDGCQFVLEAQGDAMQRPAGTACSGLGIERLRLGIGCFAINAHPRADRSVQSSDPLGARTSTCNRSVLM